MIKINKILTVFAFLFAFSATANAQTSNKNFDGFSIEVGLSNQMQSNDSAYTDTSAATTSSFEHDSESNSIPRVALNYDVQPFSRFAIGFGGSYMFGESKDSNTFFGTGMTISNATSFYIAPTFLVSDTTGMYGKISFNAAKGKYNDNNTTLNVPANDDEFIMGFGYGFGVKSFITKNLYLLAEVERVNYGRENYRMSDTESYSVDTETTNATISLGVKF